MSALKFSNQVGMRYETVLIMLRKLRLAMGSREENLMLAGHIEVDEAFFGGRLKGKKPGESAVSNKMQVVILVESEGHQAGNLVMKVIDSGEWEDLKPVVESKIESDPPVNSFRADGWQAHTVLAGLGSLNMEPIPKAFLDQELPCVSLAITHAKRFLMGTYHHFCKSYLQHYLNEFCYRWNRRGFDRHAWCQLAHRLIKACALFSPAKQATSA